MAVPPLVDPVPPLLEARGLGKQFERRRTVVERLATLGRQADDAVVRAVSDVDLSLAEGETVGLVGESGCGKSTVGRMIAGLLVPSTGTIRYRAQPRASASAGVPVHQRLKVQMVFQDPMASLNPRLTVRRIVGEAPLVHRMVPARALDAYVAELLEKVGLDPDFADRYPHQVSGGQRQRIAIARAMAVRPEVLVCDEAVSALDVSVQAQIVNLLMALRREFALTTLFISHDLGVIHHISDRVAVMYLGRIVELAPTERLFERPAHPYTRLLLAGMPTLGSGKRRFPKLDGEIPSQIAPQAGCAFRGRCDHATELCGTARPALRMASADHQVACHHDGGRD